MRMLFSVAALLVVASIVMKLAGTQLQALKPASVGGPASASTGGNAAQRAADLVNKAVEQGAAMRAADAASQ